MTTKQTNKKLVQGVGVNDLDGPVYKNGSNLKFYSTWKGMLDRCYSEKYRAKFPTYIGCSVCDEWLLLSNFQEWYNIHYRDGMALDKDILIQGNKIYCPEACRFVPQYINSLLTDAGAIRGNLPLGVRALKPNAKTGKISTTYEACCCTGNSKRITKVFKTIPEASAWYSMTKKKAVKEIALESFWRNEIVSDVATALLEREW